MTFLRKLFQTEPAVLIAVIASALALAVRFGVTITSEQTQSIVDFLALLLPIVTGLLTRQMVVPSVKVEEAHGKAGLRKASNVTKMMLPVFFLAVALTGCGAKLPPNTSIEAKLAVRGDQVVQGLRQVLPNLKPYVCVAATPAGQPCLKPADADRIAVGIGTAFLAAESLGQALVVVDNARTAGEREVGMAKARELVRSIQASIAAATIVPGDEAVRTIVVQVLGVVTVLLLAIGGF